MKNFIRAHEAGAFSKPRPTIGFTIAGGSARTRDYGCAAGREEELGP